MNNENLEIIHRWVQGNWLLVQTVDLVSRWPIGYCFVWIGDELPDDQYLRACKSVLRDPKVAIRGVSASFEDDPIPGFVLTPLPGWNLEEGNHIQHLIKQIEWEISRAILRGA